MQQSADLCQRSEHTGLTQRPRNALRAVKSPLQHCRAGEEGSQECEIPRPEWPSGWPERWSITWKRKAMGRNNGRQALQIALNHASLSSSEEARNCSA
eukprot:3097392-Rhodomonas_salina.2